MHLRAEQALGALARGLADGAEHLAAVTDDDPLVRFLRDMDGHGDLRTVLPLLERVDGDRDAVRYLLARTPEDLLADELGDEEAHRLVADLVQVVERRS